MIYIVEATTDHKYVGTRIELEKLPKIGDEFHIHDISIKVRDIVVADRITIYSYNYIVILMEDTDNGTNI